MWGLGGCFGIGRAGFGLARGGVGIGFDGLGNVIWGFGVGLVGLAGWWVRFRASVRCFGAWGVWFWDWRGGLGMKGRFS